MTIDDWGEDPSVPGRFIYTVSKKRSDERAFGFADAHNKDVATYRYDDYGGVVSIKRRHQHLFKQRESRVLG